MSRQKELNTLVRRAEVFAPAMFTSVAWDILLALLADERCELTLGKLSALCSIPQSRLLHWLANLEESGLITGSGSATPDNVRPVLTGHGRSQLHLYLLAAGELQFLCRPSPGS